MHRYICFTKSLFSALGVFFQSPHTALFLCQFNENALVSYCWYNFPFCKSQFSFFPRDRAGQTGFKDNLFQLVYTCVCVCHVLTCMCLSIWPSLCGYPLCVHASKNTHAMEYPHLRIFSKHHASEHAFFWNMFMWTMDVDVLCGPWMQ